MLLSQGIGSAKDQYVTKFYLNYTLDENTWIQYNKGEILSGLSGWD